MKTKMFAGAAAALTVMIAAAGVSLIPTQQSEAREALAADVYNVDSLHSMVFYRIEHMGVAYCYGRFNDPTGSFYINPDDLESSMIDIEVKVANVDSGNSKRDDHLRSPDFFNAKQFPTISFRSTRIEDRGGKIYAIGTLAMHGHEKEVETTVQYHGDGDTPQGYKAGFEANFIVTRSEFGMDTYVKEGGLGDDVDLYVTIEGKRQ